VRNSGKRAVKEASDKKEAKQAKHNDIAEGQQQGSTTGPTAVWTFGRTLESLLLSAVSTAAFLVIDHAERLLSLGSTSKIASADRVSFLTQLLLLPRTLGLNLTIIIITKSVMLEHSGTFRENSCYNRPPRLVSNQSMHASTAQLSTTSRHGGPSLATSTPSEYTFRHTKAKKLSKR
jgi:hypothetical protein